MNFVWFVLFISNFELFKRSSKSWREHPWSFVLRFLSRYVNGTDATGAYTFPTPITSVNNIGTLGSCVAACTKYLDCWEFNWDSVQSKPSSVFLFHYWTNWCPKVKPPPKLHFSFAETCYFYDVYNQYGFKLIKQPTYVAGYQYCSKFRYDWG